jgi:hypothetical protein
MVHPIPRSNASLPRTASITTPAEFGGPTLQLSFNNQWNITERRPPILT